MSATRRTLLTMLVTFAVAAAFIAWGVALRPAHADTVTVSRAVTSTMVEVTADNPGHVCQEDEPCWNPCTMGVNGEYPPSKPRHYEPGPCTAETPLPDGGVFAVSVIPDPNAGVACDPGTSFVIVAVMVVGTDTTGVRAEVDGHGCARSGDPLADFAEVLPGLYRAAAAQLDA